MLVCSICDRGCSVTLGAVPELLFCALVIVAWDGRNLSWAGCVPACGPVWDLMAPGGRNLSRGSRVLSLGPVWDPMSLGARVIVQVASAGCSYVVSALELRLPQASVGRGELIR